MRAGGGDLRVEGAEVLLGHDVPLGRRWQHGARFAVLEAGCGVVRVAAAEHDVDVGERPCDGVGLQHLHKAVRNGDVATRNR
jgi:hypothetical protein